MADKQEQKNPNDKKGEKDAPSPTTPRGRTIDKGSAGNGTRGMTSTREKGPVAIVARHPDSGERVGGRPPALRHSAADLSPLTSVHS